jgi:hypothetical protein
MSLTKDNKTGSQSSSCSTAACSFEREEHGRDGQDTADGRQQAHSDIWNTWLQVIHANVLEVEAAIESTEPSSQSDEEFCEGWVYVHEEPALDILGCKSTKAEHIISLYLLRMTCDRLTGPHRRRRCWAELF